MRTLAVFSIFLAGCAAVAGHAVARALPPVAPATVHAQSGLHRLILAGVVALAAAAAIAWYAGPKLAGGVAAFGGALIVGAMTTSFLAGHDAWVVAAVILSSLAAIVWHFRAYVSASVHLADGTEHLAKGRVAALIAKIRGRALTKVRA